MPLRSVTFLVPLELNCNDEEGSNTETESAYGNQEASSSEADEPPSASVVFSETNESKPAVESSEDSFMQSAIMHLSGLDETPSHESADPTQRDSQSPSPRSSVGATFNVPMETRAVDSPHLPALCRESATSSAAPSSELNTQRQPRRSAICQRQLVKDLIEEDLI